MNHLICTTEYQPEQVIIDKSALDAAKEAIEIGLEYARELIVEYDKVFGRQMRKNRVWCEKMESDIRKMESTLKGLEEKS